MAKRSPMELVIRLTPEEAEWLKTVVDSVQSKKPPRQDLLKKLQWVIDAYAEDEVERVDRKSVV